MLAADVFIVAACEAECPHLIDVIAPWARIPDERACAGTRKIRLGLGLVDERPPVQPDAVDAVLNDSQRMGESDRTVRIHSPRAHLSVYGGRRQRPSWSRHPALDRSYCSVYTPTSYSRRIAEPATTRYGHQPDRRNHHRKAQSVQLQADRSLYRTSNSQVAQLYRSPLHFSVLVSNMADWPPLLV